MRHDAPVPVQRLARLLKAPFGRASEEPYRRRTSDAVRLITAVVVVALAARRSDHPSVVSRDVFRAFNDLPGGLRPTVNVLYGGGALWAAALVGAAALIAQRWRLARDLAIAALAAWLIARGLGLVLANGFRSLRHVARAHGTPSFPNVRLALVVAVVAAASPFLSRPLRAIGWAFVALMVPSALYLGVALPRSLGCAAVLGWGVAAAVHLMFGSPGGRPTMEQVGQALADLGHPVTDVRLAERQPHAHTLVLADDAQGGLIVKVLGRDEADTRLLAKVWRFLYYKDSGPTLYLTREQEVEHQAYVTLLARDAGARVPTVLVAGTAGAGTAVLVERDPGGRPFAELSAGEISDGQLIDLWTQVKRLHAARIAHGELNTGRCHLTPDGAVLVGFAASDATGPDHARAADVAELLATTASLVGDERAVAAALSVLGPAPVAAALPLLQPAALTREGRRLAARGHTRKLEHHLAELRTAAAAAAACAAPELEQLQRISKRNLTLTLGTAVGVGALLSSVGDPSVLGHALSKAKPSALVLAFAMTLIAQVGLAFSFTGTVKRRLPFWPTVKLQIAGVFSGLALPFGGQALQVRYLQRQGIDTAVAVAAGGLVTVVLGTVAQVLVFVVASTASPQKVHVGSIPTSTVVYLLAGLAGLILTATAVLFAVPVLRRRFVPPITRGLDELLDVLRSPKQLAKIVGGNCFSYVMYGLVLTTCLYAVDAHPSPWGVIAANIGISLLASLVPFPGGGTAVSSVGLSGALVAFGVPEASAVAAVLLHQLITSYLPALPGWLALRSLLAHDEL